MRHAIVALIILVNSLLLGARLSTAASESLARLQLTPIAQDHGHQMSSSALEPCICGRAFDSSAGYRNHVANCKDVKTQQELTMRKLRDLRRNKAHRLQDAQEALRRTVTDSQPGQASGSNSVCQSSWTAYHHRSLHCDRRGFHPISPLNPPKATSQAPRLAQLPSSQPATEQLAYHGRICFTHQGTETRKPLALCPYSHQLSLPLSR